MTVQEALQQMKQTQDGQAALIRRLVDELRTVKRNGADPFSHIPGRRVWYILSGITAASFTSTNAAQVGPAINMQVSEDGPFVATHFPVIMWKVSTPSNATNFGRWRPVTHGPLPTQQVTTDFISLSYGLNDSGSGRNLQSINIPPITSRYDRLCPLPFPTIFKRAGTVIFTPYYEAIDFNSSGTATTGGLLVVGIPGYKIVPDADFMGVVP